MKEFLGITDDVFIILTRLSIVFVLSGLIGFERDKKGENAGIRTILLVGLSSCGLVLTSIFYMIPLANEEGIRIDVARIPSYIIGGIGFLGAGTIISNRNRVIGISTSATIWMVAIIGIIVGFGAIMLGILLTILSLIVLHWIKKLDLHGGKK